MKTTLFTRRAFLQHSLAIVAAAPFGLRHVSNGLLAAEATGNSPKALHRSDAKVAIVACRTYGPEVRASLKKSFDLLGGIG